MRIRPRKPEEVFTPRSADVNKQMYVNRPDLEDELIRAIRIGKHIIIFGESGSGKSWLYKEVLGNSGINYIVINLANAARKKELDAAFTAKIDELNKDRVTGEKSVKKGQLAPGGVGVETSFETTRELRAAEPFMYICQEMQKRSRKRASYVIFENFEQIVGDDEIISQLSDVIILSDDQDYDRYNVRCCIVGVPGDIRNYISRTSNVATVANRITELREVERLTKEQTVNLARKGFEEELQYNVYDAEYIYHNIPWISDRIAQHVQELCLYMAIEGEREKRIDKQIYKKAVYKWVRSSMMADHSTVEMLMNSRETKAGRRNQVLYALGQNDDEDITVSSIEGGIREEFSASTKGVSLNISGMMSELSSKENPIIKRTSKGTAYRFVSPKYRMCLRFMLNKDEDGKITKVDLKDSNKPWEAL